MNAAEGPSAEGSVTTLVRYYAQCCFAESRFPVGAKPDALRLAFSWSDAWSGSGAIKKRRGRVTYLRKMSLPYEKACILFAVGSLESAAGACDSGNALSFQGALPALHLQTTASSLDAMELGHLRAVIPKGGRTSNLPSAHVK